MARKQQPPSRYELGRQDDGGEARDSSRSGEYQVPAPHSYVDRIGRPWHLARLN